MAKLELTKTTIQVEHVTIPSEKPFDSVRSALEAAVPRLDNGIFILLGYGEGERALRELEKGPPLSIFGIRDHGALLQVRDCIGMQFNTMFAVRTYRTV